ncbi:helix-turn-helix transcriptional regulator [uncultured Vagococcus sp.]|uniref:helix-turn-helix domain-containing protein n=1 Tax=uncultured Vagococcus sp. TaxID=189676 RepID=UPI0028D7FBA4|nr:helix-turn-helix transcriptional regulator [uncultured Vagococcus sp.]
MVSDKTISSWENNRSYPDIVMLISLSNSCKISLDELIKDRDMVKTIDRNLKLKKNYKVRVFSLLFIMVVLNMIKQNQKRANNNFQMIVKICT